MKTASMCSMKSRHTFNVFTAFRFVEGQSVPAHLFLAQVDAANSTEARQAVAKDMEVLMNSLEAQFASDPRAQGQRHATQEERDMLAFHGAIVPTRH